jgi:glycosyltransferase involved in cell wall biosynthesis
VKVLHLAAGNMYGGVETLVTTLARCRQLCPEMEPHFGLCFEGRLSGELSAQNVPVHLLGSIRVSHPWTIMDGRRSLRRLLAREQFDVVITHMCWPHMLFAPIALSYTPNLVYWAHGGSEGRHWTERWASRARPAMVIANSRFVAGSVCKIFGPVRTEVISYPVSSAFESAPARNRSEVRRELGVPEGAVVIVQVSRMEAWKGHMLHLDALSSLRDISGWVCWIVGGAQKPDEQAYLSSLQRHVLELGIAGRVLFLGQRADVPQLLGAADIFCQPNQHPEPFGIVFVEALSAGLPVVATNLGGPMEIVNDRCGLLVPQDNRLALAAALRECIQNHDLRLRLGTKAPARARELCDPATQMRRLYSAFSSLASHTSAPESLATTGVHT